jgi:hypothetical protein
MKRGSKVNTGATLRHKKSVVIPTLGGGIASKTRAEVVAHAGPHAGIALGRIATGPSVAPGHKAPAG